MSTDLDLCFKHLKSLVGFDTSNPPRKIMESGLIAYLNSLDFIDPHFTLECQMAIVGSVGGPWEKFW